MPWPDPDPLNVNAAGTAGLLGLELALGVVDVPVRVLLEMLCAVADTLAFAHNEQSAIPSAMIRRGLVIIPIIAVAGEELLALESNTFLPEVRVT